MNRVPQLCLPTLIMALASGCASGNPKPLALVSPGWTPLPVAALPLPDRIRWDHESFITYADASRAAYTGAARRDGRVGSWLWYAAAGFAAIGISEHRNAVGGSSSDIERADTLVGYGVSSAAFLLWGWHRRSNAKRRLKCMTDAQELTAAFRKKWVEQTVPASHEEWAAYRGDQDRIVHTLTCS